MRSHSKILFLAEFLLAFRAFLRIKLERGPRSLSLLAANFIVLGIFGDWICLTNQERSRNVHLIAPRKFLFCAQGLKHEDSDSLSSRLRNDPAG